jgi:glycosyltransferase involved in cell wall biosynthesis
MRLLHLNAGNLYGGIETYLVTLAKLARTNSLFEHTFLLTSEGRLSTELQSLNADVHFAGTTRLSRPWTVWKSRRALQALAKAKQPDVVLAHGPWPLVIFAPRSGSHPSRSVLYLHVHHSGDWLDRLARRVPVDGIIANSAFTAGTVGGAWGDIKPSVCHYPVPTPATFDRSATRRDLGIGPDEIIILQVSRFEEWKGHLLHLEALHRLDAGRKWRAFLVGGASRSSEVKLRERVLALASRLPPGRAVLLGERTDVPCLMQAADIFCQPNYGPEPFGLVFVEALLAGLPVVTTHMGGALEILDESCGRLCNPDPNSVATALEELVGDERLRRTLGKEGPARAQRLCGVDEALRQLQVTLEKLRIPHDSARQATVWA